MIHDNEGPSNKFLKKVLCFQLGIPIAKMGTDGQMDVKDYMLYSNGLGSENLNTFSVCGRFNVEFLGPQVTSIFSYSTFISDNTLSMWLDVKDGKLELKICTYWGVSGTTVCSEKFFKSINLHNHWHHFCWLFNTDGINSEKIKLSTKLFFDGKEVNKGDPHFANLSIVNEIHKDLYLFHFRYNPY